MKKLFFLVVLLWCHSAVADVQLAHYWNFDEYAAFGKPAALSDTLPYDPDGIWTLNLKKVGQQGAYVDHFIKPASMVNPAYSQYGYGGAYGNFYHVGAPGGASGNGYAYLSCQGVLLDFKAAWSYSITSWIKPEVTGRMVLFSIGMAGEGFQLIYDSATNSLTYNLHGIAADFGSLNMGAAFGGDSDFRHIGFSMDYDGQGNMAVDYYLNGVKYIGSTASVAGMMGQTISGFNIGADGTDGGLSGSCNYDDIKVFKGVLNDAEIKDAMNPGIGSFIIEAPSMPEPATPLLACLGSLFLLRRRRLA